MIIQASSSTGVPSSDDTLWPPPGGLEKQLNLWWSLGADAGVAFWLWKGSREYPFVGLADPAAPAHALPETEALLTRIPDGELSTAHGSEPSEAVSRDTPAARAPGAVSLPAVRIRPPTVAHG